MTGFYFGFEGSINCDDSGRRWHVGISILVTAASCGSSSSGGRSTISLVYGVVSAIGGIVSGGFLLLLCEDVVRRLKIGISLGAIVAISVPPGTAVISRRLTGLLLIVADAIDDTLEAGVSPVAPKRRRHGDGVRNVVQHERKIGRERK
jgi:hypothetical protein